MSLPFIIRIHHDARSSECQNREILSARIRCHLTSNIYNANNVLTSDETTAQLQVLHPECGGIKFFRNSSKCLPHHTASNFEKIMRIHFNYRREDLESRKAEIIRNSASVGLDGFLFPK
jgi:hypothetical protein